MNASLVAGTSWRAGIDAFRERAYIAGYERVLFDRRRP
jgi:hypothetical protein